MAGKGASIVYFGYLLKQPFGGPLWIPTTDKSFCHPGRAFYLGFSQNAMKNGKIEIGALIPNFPLEKLEEGIRFMNDNTQQEKIKSVIVFD